MTEKTERAKEQAKAQLESIVAMVKRLEHAQDCDGDPEDCELTDAEIFAGLNLSGGNEAASEDERSDYHNEDAARLAIEEDPLEVSVRTGWHSPGSQEKPGEYRILLCWGGPACQIIGELTEHGEPDNAEIRYQDWFTEWITYPVTSDEEKALLTYAQQFYFAE